MNKTALILSYLLLTIFLHAQEVKPQMAQVVFKKIRNEQLTSDPNIVWKNIGPGMSGYNEEFWCHPSDADVMFMGPDMHVSYGSWDNGKSWHTIKDSDGDGQDMERVLDLAFSTQNPDFGVALERRGKVFTTNDRGRSWQLVHTIKREGKKSYYNAHTKLAIHPSNDDVWLIGAGDFWNVKKNHRSQANPHGLKSGRASYGYILKTTDGGKTWKKVATDISPDLDVARIIYHPEDHNVIITATSHGVYRSEDGGEKWLKSGRRLPNNLPRDMVSFYDAATNDFVLYLVEQTIYEPNGKTILTKGGVFKSVDGGQNWQDITGNLGFNYNEINNAALRGNYYKAVGYWLGVNAREAHPEFPDHTFPVFNRLVVNPTNKEEIYLVSNMRHDKGMGPGDVWKTADGGKTWIICARSGNYWVDQKDKAYWTAKGNPIGANVEFAHLQRSIDEGSETANGNRMLAINSKGDVFIGVNQQTIRSTDGGKTWKQIDDDETVPGSDKWIGRGASNLPGRQMLLETGIKDRYLLCSGEHGLWQTTDIGDWPDKRAVAVEQIEGQVHDHSGNHGAHSISTVAVHPQDPNTIYILMWRQEHRGKLRRTIDGGKTWENIATIFEGNNQSWKAIAYQNSLIIDPENPDNMYFCATRHAIQEVGTSVKESVLKKGGYGVYRSTDGGYNWTLSNQGLPDIGSVRRLVMHPDQPEVIYACLNKRSGKEPAGLYMSQDKAKTWSPVKIPASIQGVNHLFIHPKTKEMLLSGGYRKGTSGSGGVWKSSDNGKTWKLFFNAPYVWQTEVSTVDPDIVLVNVPLLQSSPGNAFKNPGIYLSIDGGETWAKINKGLGQPDKMTDIKTDPYDKNKIWSAGWGSGWFVAYLDH
ncbi:MAG: hypothetical protein AAGA66_10135 [Bacteroidota bacterium]